MLQLLMPKSPRDRSQARMAFVQHNLASREQGFGVGFAMTTETNGQGSMLNPASLVLRIAHF